MDEGKKGRDGWHYKFGIKNGTCSPPIDMPQLMFCRNIDHGIINCVDTQVVYQFSAEIS